MKHSDVLICTEPKPKNPKVYKIEPPFTLETDDDPPMLNLSALPKEKRREVWERIKRERPKTAAAIESEEFQAIRKAFGGDVLIKDFD